LPFPGESRAFTGIDDRLWATLDDFIPRIILSKQTDPEAYRSELAQRAYSEFVKFRARAAPSVLSDCFHLSVMTIASVGYGNIAPSTWYSKLATDFEALTGIALLVIALGMLFSQWNSTSPKTN
jgi:hypothetical protein